MLKKLIASIVIATQLLAIASPLSIAQAQESGTWYNQSFQEWATKVYDDQNPTEIFGERYTAAQVQWVMYSFFVNMFLILSGNNKDLIQCFNYQSDGCVSAVGKIAESIPQLQTQDYGNQSLLSAVFEDRPLSGITYVKDSLRKFHIIPEAKAQTPGFGYRGLSFIQDAWRAVRNISYTLFILAAIILSFMIMFRVKISPQVVISIQSAIPKLVITLILVTFSYAIAGFLVDIMYILIGLISLFLSQVSVFGVSDTSSPLFFFNLLTKGPPLNTPQELGSFELGQVGGTGILGFFISYWIHFLMAVVLTFVFGIVGALSSAFSTSFGAAGGGLIISFVTIVIGVITFLILILILIINFLKTIWMLVKTFASILMLTIFSPIQLTAGIVIPNMGIGSWIRQYFSKLAVFPVTGLLILLAFWFLGLGVTIAFSQAGLQIQTLDSVYLGNTVATEDVRNFVGAYQEGWPPLLGGLPQTAALLMLLASVVIILIIPKAADMVESLIAGKPFAFGAALKEAGAPAVAYGRYGFLEAGEGRYPEPLGVLGITRRLPPIDPRLQAQLQNAARALGLRR